MDGWGFLKLYNEHITNYQGKQPIIITITTNQNPTDKRLRSQGM
ncbi:MAG: hypothetical protein ACI81S_000372 [Sphingobacteriales bacterium]|jgi:hypothetical protein